MQIKIDDNHIGLVEKAVAEGRAADAQAYLHRLIESDAADQWVIGQRGSIEDMLRSRLTERGVERQPEDFESLRQRVLAQVEQRRNRRTA